MTGNKTAPTEASVKSFIASVDNARRREDAETLLALFKKVSGLEAKMWGPSIIGFGSYHYTYDSGREGDMLMTGFSPRKANLVLYVSGGFKTKPELRDKLGKYKTGKSCLYINKLADVDMAVLEELITADIAYMRETYDTA